MNSQVVGLLQAVGLDVVGSICLGKGSAFDPIITFTVILIVIEVMLYIFWVELKLEMAKMGDRGT